MSENGKHLMPMKLPVVTKSKTAEINSSFVKLPTPRKSSYTYTIWYTAKTTWNNIIFRKNIAFDTFWYCFHPAHGTPPTAPPTPPMEIPAPYQTTKLTPTPEDNPILVSRINF